MKNLIDSDLIGKITDSEQKEVLLKLGDNARAYIDETTEKAVMDALEKKGIDREMIGMSDIDKAALKLRKSVRDTKSVWDSNGYVRGVAERITYSDLAKRDQERKAAWEKNGRKLDGVFSTDQPMIIPRVIEEMVREPIEPTIVLTGLLRKINVSNMGTTITFPAVGNAMTAADIPEAGEYPEGSLEFAGEVQAKIGKSGIAVKLTEEMVRYSMFDVMSMHLKAARAALVRHKEQKVADLIFNAGSTIFDNGPSGTYRTSGLDQNNALNDTITADDIFAMYAEMRNDGFIPDTLIMHPFAWYGFARDPIMRDLFMQGMGGAFWQPANGSPGGANWGGLPLGQKSYVSDPGQVATTYTVPGMLPVPLTIVVTPFQTCDVAAGTSTITMCQRSELGMLLEDEAVAVEEFNDPARDIMKVKMRERYALAVSLNGQAIKHAKNVNWRRKCYDIGNRIQATWTVNTGSVTTGVPFPVGNSTL